MADATPPFVTTNDFEVRNCGVHRLPAGFATSRVDVAGPVAAVPISDTIAPGNVIEEAR
jgi:hypothetical protein